MASVASIIARGTRPHLPRLKAHSTGPSLPSSSNSRFIQPLSSSHASRRTYISHSHMHNGGSRTISLQLAAGLSKPSSPLRRGFLPSRQFSQLWRKLQTTSNDPKTPPSSTRSTPSQPSQSQQHIQTPSTTIPQPSLVSPTRHENIYTIPNFLTATRLLAAPAIGYFILHQNPFLALSLFLYAGITDAVDGYIARHYSSTTVLGTILDPMADKLLMTITVSTLAWSAPALMPWWLATIILGRDVGLAISALWWRYISLPEPKTMSRYWDFSLPSAEVRPTEISKINTLLQLCYVGGAMVLPVLPETIVGVWNLGGVLEGWGYLVATTTVWSGASYVFTKDAVRVLSKDEVKKAEEKRDEKEG